MIKTYHCHFCDVELNGKNLEEGYFTPRCKKCHKKEEIKKFQQTVGGILNSLKRFDIAYYNDNDTNNIIVKFEDEYFTLSVNKRD